MDSMDVTTRTLTPVRQLCSVIVNCTYQGQSSEELLGTCQYHLAHSLQPGIYAQITNTHKHTSLTNDQVARTSDQLGL